jgi:DNA-binding FadR family transcriptional regulator
MTRRAGAPRSSRPDAETRRLPDIESTDVSPEADSRLRYRVIHDQLKSAIALGNIAPGLVLLEGPVARIFGTSRVPVRKAFEMLHAGGLLITFEGRGYLVARADGSAPEPLRAPISEETLGFDRPPEPLDIPTNAERIYDSLEAAISLAIVFGHFRIDESNAAEAFGVSRGTVREVLNRLRDRGLVEKSAYSHWLCGPVPRRCRARSSKRRWAISNAPSTIRTLFMPRHCITSKPRYTIRFSRAHRTANCSRRSAMRTCR